MPAPTQTPAPASPGLRGWGVVSGIALVMGILESSKTYVFAGLDGQAPTVIGVLIGNLPWWFIWGLLTPGIFKMGQRWPLSGKRLWPSVAVHIPASILFGAIHLSLTGTIYQRTRVPDGDLGAMLLNWTGAFLFLELATYWLALAIFQSWSHRAQFRERERAAARLEGEKERLAGEAARAKLRALQMELQPHFLFNTLNAITSLVRQGDNKKATDMIVRLGDLLRLTLERKEEPLVLLAEELELAECYLGIQKVRFPDLDTTVQVDPTVVAARVPTLILQPLVENAIRHGLAGSGKGWIRIEAGRNGDQLTIEVTDSGAGTDAKTGGEVGRRKHSGVGLTNTRARLEQLWPGDTSVELNATADHGTRVTISLPLQLQPSARQVADASPDERSA